jgi:hypothetical protein
MRHICAAVVPGNVKYFKYDWKKESWNLFLILGLLIGGAIAATFMSNPHDIAISEGTNSELTKTGYYRFLFLHSETNFFLGQTIHLSRITNPQNITVRSSFGGEASRGVTQK